MKLFKNISNKFRSSTETSSITLNPTVEELRAFFKADIEEISDSRLNSSTYYTCMLIRCNAIAKLSLKLKQKEEKKGSRNATEHPLYKILKTRPNPFISSHDFLWATEFQRLEYGNAYWVYDTSRGTIKNFYLLESSRVEIMIDNSNILSNKNSVYYIYNDPKQGQLIYTSDNILHFKNFAMSGIKGTSIKKYMSDIIANEQYATKVLKGKYKNGLQDPIIVQYTGDLNEAKQNKIKKKFQGLGGAQNAGKVVPIPTDFKVEQLETKLVNSQFFQLQGLTTRQIANAFGVKGFQLNDMEKSTYNNIEQQNKAFYSDTLQNPLTAYEQEMTYKTLTTEEQNKGYYWEFNVDTMLRSDLQTRYQAYNSAIDNGWRSRAEVRELEGLPYEEGTEQLTVGNGACIPLKDLGKQYVKGGDE